MADAADHIRNIIKGEHDLKTLPGLASRKWDGFILIDCVEHGYPCLLLPDDLRELVRNEQP